MTRPSPLPEPLRGRPFTVAEAQRLGMSARALRGDRFRSPHRGVRVPVELPDTLPVRCAALQLLLPAGGCFGGLTALGLQRLPLPPADERLPRGLCVVVPPGPVPVVAGVDVATSRFSARQRLVEVRELPGVRLRVLHPLAAWCDVAPSLGLAGAVALGDQVRRRWCDDAAMSAAVRARADERGVVALREAVALVRHPVDSWWESVLRVLLVGAGVPEPVVNADVSADGGWLARPDLSWPSVQVAVEYDGDHHRTSRRQWRSDRLRARVLRQNGWLVIELTADDVRVSPQRTVADIAAALRGRGLVW